MQSKLVLNYRDRDMAPREKFVIIPNKLNEFSSADTTEIGVVRPLDLPQQKY